MYISLRVSSEYKNIGSPSYYTGQGQPLYYLQPCNGIIIISMASLIEVSSPISALAFYNSSLWWGGALNACLLVTIPPALDRYCSTVITPSAPDQIQHLVQLVLQLSITLEYLQILCKHFRLSINNFQGFSVFLKKKKRFGEWWYICICIYYLDQACMLYCSLRS